MYKYIYVYVFIIINSVEARWCLVTGTTVAVLDYFSLSNRVYSQHSLQDNFRLDIPRITKSKVFMLLLTIAEHDLCNTEKDGWEFTFDFLILAATKNVMWYAPEYPKSTHFVCV